MQITAEKEQQKNKHIININAKATNYGQLIYLEK